PLMIEAYELIKKYYYEDISWETFQDIAAAAFAGSLDKFSGIVGGESSAVSSGAIGLHVSSTIYNEHVVTFAVPNMPAYSATAIKRFDTYDENLYDDDGVALLNDVYVREGDKIFAVGVEGYTQSGEKVYSTVKVESANLTFFSQIMSLFVDYDELVYMVNKYVGDGEYEDGYYAFKIRRSTYEESEKYAYYYSITDDVGLIRLTQFYRDGDFDFASCIVDFISEGKKKLILDLRDNGGGELTSLQYIAQFLLNNPESKQLPIMNLIYNSGYGNMKSAIEYSSNTNPTVVNLPIASPLANRIEGFEIVVLTNENTASASEGLIGALQYYNDVKIVGTTTYGKGVAQISIPLSTGDYLYVTNGRYYVPTADSNGNLVWERTIHEIGFTPLKENIVEDRIADYAIDKCVARALELFGA
ncbi:MAG: S41 family peptidase, partial [Clostridia bacterium]|nr:S41 family peptidase [Clostridia bacterium]